MTNTFRFVVLGLATLVLATSLAAQTPPMQDEFQVSQGTSGYQYIYGAAIDHTGRFVVAWTDDSSSSSYDCFGRLYDAAGAAEGGEFQIDPSATHQYFSDVAKDQSGRFIVAWNEGVADVRARRFQADGTPLGASFPVNTAALPVFDVRVASDPSGNFAVAWTREGATDTDVVARLFDSSNAPVSNEFVVNAYTSGIQNARGVAMSGDGFVVAWSGQSPAGIGVSARRYDAAGNPMTGDLPVSQGPVQFLGSEAEVAMSGSGAFVVAWDGQVPPSGVEVLARRYDTAGAPIGGEFPVNTTYTSGAQGSSRVSSDDAGNFIVTWTGNPLDGSDSGVAARRFDRFGDPVSSDFMVNTTTTDFQYSSQVALNAAGSFVVAWQSPDNDGYGVFARRSAVQSAGEIEVDIPIANTPASVTENGVLEPGETANVATGWINETASDLAMTGTATDFSGPAGATYTLEDASADYGAVAAQATGSCVATGDCYAVTVSAPVTRPVQHWDTQLQEALSLGVPRTWNLHVGESFPDVPTGNIFYRFIETLFHSRVTGGCAGGNYCPVNPVTRAQMAVFLLKAKFGSAHIPPPCTGTVFTDVPCTGGPFDPWIEELAGLAITGGCGGGNYCPNATVTRQQMAVFLLKALEGSSYNPPACTQIFADVPCTPGLGFSDWIEELYNRAITGGCSAVPLNYCPTNPNNRGQMAVFLTKTFGLVLYGT